MKQLNHGRKTLTLICATALIAGATARADHTVGDIPLAPHGDTISYSDGALPLTPTSLVVTAEGDDDEGGTVDDKLLIVTGVGGTPNISDSVVGGFPKGGARWARLSATRALNQTAGADGEWSTGDETLLIVDAIGSENTVSQVVVGSLQNSQGGAHVPARLSPDTAVMVVNGDDNENSTSDDAVALITDIGGTPQITILAAPFLEPSGRTQPTALTPTSFLISSNGPDGEVGTADDLVYLFTDVGGTNTRTDLAVPYLHPYRPGCPVRVTSTTAAVISQGPDGSQETADDRVFVLSELGTTNTVASASLPYLACCGASRPRVLGPDLLAIPTWGADGAEGTQDDTLAFVSNLGGPLSIAETVVGPIDEDRQGRPVRLTGHRVLVVTEGPDNSGNSADDRLAIVSDVGGANTVTSIDVPGLGRGGATEPIAISSTAVLLLSGGPDGVSNSGNDDVFTLVTGLDTATPTAVSVPLGTLGGQGSSAYGLAARPAYAGGGRAVASGTGPDGSASSGGDDVVHVIDNLPEDRAVSVKKLEIKFKADKPAKGEKFSVKADLQLDDPALFGMGDITISIGNAAETIPADAIATKKGKPTYKRPKGGSGFIKKLVYNPKKGTLSITGKGLGTGAETTNPEFIPFTIDITDGLFVGETLVGEVKGSGLKYKRSK